MAAPSADNGASAHPADIELASASNTRGAVETNFPVQKEQLELMAEDREFEALERLGGVKKLAEDLHSDTAHGLTSAQVEANREFYGINRLPDKTAKTLLELFWESLDDLTLAILEVAGVISVIFGVAVSKTTGDWIQGLAILIAVVVVSTVVSFQNYSQQLSFESLQEVKDDRDVEVRRDGKDINISVFDIVVGDVFRANNGELLPCDGVLISGQNVKADESAMTGESKAVHKSAHFPFMVGGSKLVSGDSRMLVTTVGENTSYGQIVKRLQDEEEKETPLQEKLTVLALQIGYLGFVVGALTVIVLLIAYFASGAQDDAGKDGEPSVFISILRMIVLGITIVVVAVPEGLPLAVTISLAFSMKRMYNDKCLVRELAACETMGSATCICSDKTGTLTENRMTVRQGFINGRFIAQDPSKPEEAGDATDVQVIGHCCALNSTARLEYRSNNDGKPTYLDAPTEGCLLHMVYKGFGVDFDALRQSDTYMDPYFRQPFSSERKRMTSMYEGQEEWHGDFVVFCKGASEIVLGDTISTYYRAPGGKTIPLDDKLDAATAGALDGAKEGQSMREYLLEKVDTMASLGLRTLSIGYKSVKASELPHGHEDSDSRDTILGRALEDGTLEQGLVITGVVGIEDPVREGVPEAVATCKEAGIRVRMVTGDNRKTAESIARQCGILTEGGLVMLGKEFRALSEQERMDVLPKMDVMARSSPTDKLLMVKGLQALGETVSVTGDGTNDAPALMAADIGLSMGITGTEVAKEASKIVITDDKFTSIVTAVKWGRSVLKNIRSFLQFQLTINIVALSVTFVVATTNNGDTSNFPINPVQLLWINLIMDSFAALALATEPPDDHLLTEKPVRREDALITPHMWRNMIGHSIVQTAILLWMSLDKSGADVFLIDSDKHFQDETHYTAVFNAFVWLQIFNKFNARKLRNELNVFEGLFDSYISVGVILIIIAGQVFIVEVGGDITSTVGLSWEAWLISIAIGAISLPVGFLLKFYEPPQVDCPNLFACLPGAGGDDKKAESDEEETVKPQGAWATKAAPADDGAVLPAAADEEAGASAGKAGDDSKLVAP